MISVSKSESMLIRKVYPVADIASTRYHRFVPEERRFMLLLAENGNEEAKEVLRERYDCMLDERV